MSLTSFLQISDVKARFRQEFQKPKFTVKRDILASPLTKRYTLMGTAFDYLLRFYLRRAIPFCNDKDHWVAEHAFFLLANNPPLLQQAKRIVAQAKARVDSYLQTGRLDDDLLESALQLATLDPIYRAGRGHELIGQVDPQDIADLRNLISLVDPSIFKARQLCLLNPTFGEASLLVGGADADLVIDDMIIEIKTVQRLELKRETFDQLLGYYTLHQIGGVADLQPKPDFNRIAVYFSRHAYLHVIDLDQVINPATYPDFVQWFKERAGQEKRVPALNFTINNPGAAPQVKNVVIRGERVTEIKPGLLRFLQKLVRQRKKDGDPGV